MYYQLRREGRVGKGTLPTYKTMLWSHKSKRSVRNKVRRVTKGVQNRYRIDRTPLEEARNGKGVIRNIGEVEIVIYKEGVNYSKRSLEVSREVIKVYQNTSRIKKEDRS